MAVFAISDLHLSFSTNKPMDVFGEQWANYVEKIKESWLNEITPEDIVLIGGDISWAMHLPEVKADLDFVTSMPGKKYMIKGNHDYWWNSLSKLRAGWPEIGFVHNNAFLIDDIAIAGSRGWVCPGSKEFSEDDMRIYSRELLRFENSLKQAKALGGSTLVAMLHYPPTNEKYEDSGFTALCETYGVSHLIYGHLHSPEGFRVGHKGERNGVMYHLTSCDYLDFKVKKILE